MTPLQALYMKRFNTYCDLEKLQSKYNKNPKKIEDRVMTLLSMLQYKDEFSFFISNSLQKVLVKNLGKIKFFDQRLEVSNYKKSLKLTDIFREARNEENEKFLLSVIHTKIELTLDEIDNLFNSKCETAIINYWEQSQYQVNREDLNRAIEKGCEKVVNYIVNKKSILIDDEICINLLKKQLQDPANNYLRGKLRVSKQYESYKTFMKEAIENNCVKTVYLIKQQFCLTADQEFELFCIAVKNSLMSAELFLPRADSQTDYVKRVFIENKVELAKVLRENEINAGLLFNKHKYFFKELYSEVIEIDPLMKEIFAEDELFIVFLKHYSQEFCLKSLIYMIANMLLLHEIDKKVIYHSLIQFLTEKVEENQIDTLLQRYPTPVISALLVKKFKNTMNFERWNKLFKTPDISFVKMFEMKQITELDRGTKVFNLILSDRVDLIKNYLESCSPERASTIVKHYQSSCISTKGWGIVEIFLKYISLDESVKKTLLTEASKNKDINVLKNITNLGPKLKFSAEPVVTAIYHLRKENLMFLIESNIDEIQGCINAILSQKNMSEAHRSFIADSFAYTIDLGADINTFLDKKYIDFLIKLLKARPEFISKLKLSDDALENLDLHFLLNKKEFHDRQICIDGDLMGVNSKILSKRSKYFNLLFSGGFKEENMDSIHIDLKSIDLTHEQFLQIIDYIYKLDEELITEASFKFYAIAAEYFAIDHLKDALNRWVRQNDLHSHYKKYLTMEFDGKDEELPAPKKQKLK